MSAPIIIVGIGIGAFVGHLVRKYVIDKFRAPKTALLMIIIMLPVFLSGANWVERATNDFVRTETITSTILLDATGGRLNGWALRLNTTICGNTCAARFLSAHENWVAARTPPRDPSRLGPRLAAENPFPQPRRLRLGSRVGRINQTRFSGISRTER